MPRKRKIQVQPLTSVIRLSNPCNGFVKREKGFSKSLYLLFFNISSSKPGKPAQGVPLREVPSRNERRKMKKGLQVAYPTTQTPASLKGTRLKMCQVRHGQDLLGTLTAVAFVPWSGSNSGREAGCWTVGGSTPDLHGWCTACQGPEVPCAFRW